MRFAVSFGCLVLLPMAQNMPGMPKCCAVFPLQGLGTILEYTISIYAVCKRVTSVSWPLLFPFPHQCYVSICGSVGERDLGGECPNMTVLMHAEHTGESSPRLSL